MISCCCDYGNRSLGIDKVHRINLAFLIDRIILDNAKTVNPKVISPISKQNYIASLIVWGTFVFRSEMFSEREAEFSRVRVSHFQMAFRAIYLGVSKVVFFC